MKLRWSQRARRDLFAIAAFIARDRPRAARSFVERIRGRMQQAAESPRAGRRVPEVNRDDLREVLVGNYRVVYKLEKSSVAVVTVFEGHRLLDPTLARRNDD